MVFFPPVSLKSALPLPHGVGLVLVSRSFSPLKSFLVPSLLTTFLLDALQNFFVVPSVVERSFLATFLFGLPTVFNGWKGSSSPFEKEEVFPPTDRSTHG